LATAVRSLNRLFKTGISFTFYTSLTISVAMSAVIGYGGSLIGIVILLIIATGIGPGHECSMCWIADDVRNLLPLFLKCCESSRFRNHVLCEEPQSFGELCP
jgi:hypothetical protein